MQKQTPLMSALFVTMLSTAPIHVSNADSRSMNDVTRALQAEYQTQLNKPKPKSRSKAENDIMQQYQRLIRQEQAAKNRARQKARPQPQVRRPVARPATVSAPRPAVRVVEKPPIPDAEDLFDAASNGDVGTISRLLQEGININVANGQRETALHMAAARGHYSAVIFLIKNGGNPFLRTVKNWLPIHHATRFRHANIANYLMQRGLSPHFKTSDGYSSIDMARTNNDRRLLNVFGAR